MTTKQAPKTAARTKPAKTIPAKTIPAKTIPAKTIKVTLVRSVINTRESHRATVRGLGLRRINHTVEVEDTPAVRGMINKVGYLLRLED